MLGMNSAGEAYPLTWPLGEQVRYQQFLKSLPNRIIFLLLKSAGRDLSKPPSTGASRFQSQGQLSIDLAEGRGSGSMGWQEAVPSLLGQVPS